MELAAKYANICDYDLKLHTNGGLLLYLQICSSLNRTILFFTSRFYNGNYFFKLHNERNDVFCFRKISLYVFVLFGYVLLILINCLQPQQWLVDLPQCSLLFSCCLTICLSGKWL